MPITIAELRAVVTADTQGFERGMRTISIGVAAAGAAMAALGAAVGALIKSGSDLQRTFQQVQANTDMTIASMHAMEETIISLGARSPATFEDLAKGYMHIANFGFQAADATKILDIAMQAAVATGSSVEATANVLAAVLHEFGLSGEQAAAAMNTLHHAAALGNLTLEQFVAVSGRVFSTAANLSVPLDQAAAALAALTRAGFTSQQAATQLVNIMQRIVAPTKDAKDEIARLSKVSGVDLVRDFSLAGLQSKGLIGVLTDLKTAAGANSDEMLQLFGRLRGGIGAMALIGNASADLNKIFGELSDTMSGRLTPVQDNYKIASETLAFQLGTLQNKFQLLGFELFTALGPQLTASLEVLNNTVLKTIGFIANLPPQIVAATVAFTTAVGVVGAVTVAVSALVLLLGAPVLAAMAGVATAVGLMAAAFVTNFGGITSAVGTWVGGMQVGFRSIAGFIGSLLDAWLVFQRMFVQGVDVVVTAVRVLIGAMAAAGSATEGGLKATVGFLTQDVAMAAAGIAEIGAAAKSGFDDAWTQIKGFGERFVANAKATAGNFQGQWKNAFQGAVDSAGEFAKGVSQKAGELAAVWKKAGEAPAQAMKEGGKKAKDETEKILAAQLAAVNDWLKATGQQLQISEAAWKLVPEATKKALMDQAAAFHKSTEEAQAWQAAQLAAAIASGEAFRPAMQIALNAVEELTLAEGDLTDSINKSAQAMIAATEPTERAGGAMQVAANQIQEDWKNLAEQARILREQLPTAWNTITDAIIMAAGRSGRATAALTVTIKGYAVDIMNVFADMPGKWGSAFQRAVGEVQRWINFLDSVIKLIQRIMGANVTGLQGVIQDIIGIFHKSQQPIQDAADAVGDSLDSMQKKAKDAAQSVGGAMGDMANQTQAATKQATSAIGKYVTAALQMLGGLALIISGHAQGGISGGLTGAIGGLMLGASIGSFFGPLGTAIGAGIGAVGGFFAGIFGGGKSDLQKAQEAAQLQQAKDAITISQQQAIQAVEQTKQSMIDTASKIRDLLESITFYTEIPKEAFTAFFHDLDKLMDKFAARAEAWSADSAAKIKAFSEDMQQVVAGLAAVPAILNGISAHLGVSDASIERFFNDLGKVLIAFEAQSENFARKFLRKARIFAERIQEAVGILPDIISAITGMVNIRPVPTANFDIFEQSLTEITNRIGKIATNFDKYTAKLIGFFATQIGPAVTLWKDAIDAIKSMADLTPPAPEAFTALFSGIETVLNGMSELAGKIQTESLVRAQAIAIVAGTIFGAIKDGVDALKSLADFKAVAPEAFQALLDGFDEAIAILNQLLEKATSFESIAAQIEAKLKSAAEHMAAGALAMAAALSKGGSTTGGTVGVSGLTPAPASAAVSAGSQPISVSVTVQGSLIHQAQLEDVIVSAIKNATTRGRNTMGIGWPGPIAKTI